MVNEQVCVCEKEKKNRKVKSCCAMRMITATAATTMTTNAFRCDSGDSCCGRSSRSGSVTRRGEEEKSVPGIAVCGIFGFFD